MLREVDIAEWQVRSQIGFIPEEGRVQLITVRGDSMHPDVKNGDVVMVDTARGFFDGDGVYLINLNGYTMVKRLQMLPNGLHIVSTNPKYQNAVLPPDEIDTLHVAGRIVGAALMRRARISSDRQRKTVTKRPRDDGAFFVLQPESADARIHTESC